MTPVDVVIVGAGISGLALADQLVANDVSVKVLEARDRVGGRLESVSVPGGRADLGATWFWSNEPRVHRLVERYAIPVHEQWSEGDMLVEVGGSVDRMNGSFSTNGIRFSEGAARMADKIARALPDCCVALNSQVNRITRAGTGVTISTNDEKLQADVAVVALPPSLAMAKGILDPADLSPTVAAAARDVAVWMGSTTKAVAVYDEPFWRGAGLSGTASCRSGPLFEIHDMSGHHGKPAMLFGFGGTRPGTELDRNAVIAQLTALFGKEAESPTDVLIRDWRTEEHTAPPAWPPSQRLDLFGSPALAAASWDGGLYWTSTETSAAFPGHIEGALEAAERTAHAILSRH